MEENLLMLDPLFIDTWGWIAIGHRQEPRHQEIKQFYEALRRHNISIYTTDYVLDEVVTLLFSRESFEESIRFVQAIMAAVNKGFLSMVRITPEYFTEAWDLRKRFRDKPRLSFTDLTSMVVMRDLRINRVLTEDEHFLQVGMGFVTLP